MNTSVAPAPAPALAPRGDAPSPRIPLASLAHRTDSETLKRIVPGSGAPRPVAVAAFNSSI
ncbi:hypothetical protein LO771_06700 [Streptacidiphilus sp. ASG 303]|uniref:hypothetical protein n=1 Tax=Streptacidiphilus sp. ASG 303 TaxID=2896847 RepID=UPI001E43684D|nr:hypothetical protein [Streptacidiphilus sp. ASG 303]MCD0482113.1 hypothetical protein [Streptacidiphilus sp. ASG 303]